MWEDRIVSLNSRDRGRRYLHWDAGTARCQPMPMNGTLGVVQHHPDGRVRCLPSSP